MKNFSERHVQAIWYDASFRPQNLYTRRGSAVRVISPGEWNLGAGPDFRNAVLEIGSDHKRISGDVEVHVCPADWDLHRHGSDPNYRNVIAHVTWRCGPDPATLPHGAITIWLGRFIATDPKFDPSQIDLSAYPYAKDPWEGSARPQWKNVEISEVRNRLMSAGRHRLRLKARRLVGRMTAERNNRQIYYEEVMGALGYCRNSPQFRRVAMRVTIDEMPRDVDGARNALMTAGSFEDWDTSSMRPWNRPEKRLSGAAALFTRTPIMSFADADDFRPMTLRRMVSEMRGDGIVGKGRAAAIIANVIVPWAIAAGRLEDAPEWLPPEDLSDVIRRKAHQLFGRDHNPARLYAGNDLLVQGMYELPMHL